MSSEQRPGRKRCGSELSPSDQFELPPAQATPSCAHTPSRERTASSSAASETQEVSPAVEFTEEMAWRKDVDERLDIITEELDAMNEGIAEDVDSLREQVTNLTKLMHQLLARFDAEEKY